MYAETFLLSEQWCSYGSRQSDHVPGPSGQKEDHQRGLAHRLGPACQVNQLRWREGAHIGVVGRWWDLLEVAAGSARRMAGYPPGSNAPKVITRSVRGNAWSSKAEMSFRLAGPARLGRSWRQVSRLGAGQRRGPKSCPTVRRPKSPGGSPPAGAHGEVVTCGEKGVLTCSTI